MSYLTKEALLALGFSQVGDDVKVSPLARLYAIEGSLGNRVRIDDFAILTGQIELGDDVHVSPFCFLGGTGGRIRLEHGAGMSTHVSLFTKSDDYSRAQAGPRDKVCGDITLGRYTILGAQCVVLPGADIGEGCNFGVGCVVSGAIPAGRAYVSMGIKMVNVGKGEA
jgi:acetyltransferase-like isoleucine patch superfamily enzyme